MGDREQGDELCRVFEKGAGVRLECGGMSRRNRLARDPVDDSTEPPPRVVVEPRRGRVRGAAGCCGAVRRSVERKDEDVAAAVVEQLQPLAADLEGVLRGALRRTRQRGVDL